MLYHGSKTPHIKTLKPFPHNIVNNEEVVFATNDIRFALAMIHGTSKEIDAGHEVNQNTGEDKMYIKELIPSAFNIISKPGIIYTLEDSGFINDPRLSRNELISTKDTKVLEEKYYENILTELKNLDIEFIYFKPL
jgi:hypothetical protein